MKNLWNDADAQKFKDNALALRAYSSRLLGQEPALVLHGGGNTSVKHEARNLFGELEQLLYVKGSGWDLATIEEQGFAPVKMEALLKMAALEVLSDSDMVRGQRAAMTNPQAPAPSVEAILHAIIPFKYVDHTHSDAVVAICNSPQGDKAIREVYGNRVLYVPYVMPGFILARKVYEMTRDVNWDSYEGMVLLNHGIFSFANGAKESYEGMIKLVSKAEDYLKAKGAFEIRCGAKDSLPESLLELAALRKDVSQLRGGAVVANGNSSPEALAYVGRDDLPHISQQGPLTPDHVLHTKIKPLLLGRDDQRTEIQSAVKKFRESYEEYFSRNAKNFPAGSLKCLDPAPRWAVWPGRGVFSFGGNAKQARVISDIVRHTMKGQQWSQALGGWKALPEKDIFEVEYWELEQAKLKNAGSPGSLQGKIALITGAASGIGKACVGALRSKGAAVVAVDMNPEVKALFTGVDVLSIVADLSKRDAVDDAVAQTIRAFGGLDIVVPNAGLFPSSKTIDSLDDDSWKLSMDVNLTGQMFLLRACAPYLALGVDPAIVVVASKNVPAPGPGAAAYSAAKAGMTQLARIAALEMGPKGVRVNMLHPHAVMDTALWTPELLESRAKNYKMTVDEYKKNNLLKVEVKSADVAELVAAMAGPLFSKVTGAQVAIDGGSDRII